MKYFVINDFEIDYEKHINFIRNNISKFQPVEMVDKKLPDVINSSEGFWGYYTASADDILKECCKKLNISESLISLQTYLIVPPYMETFIHSDQDRKCALAIEFLQVGGSIEWFDGNNHVINSYDYKHPVVIDVSTDHRGKGGKDWRYQIQLNFDINLDITDVFDLYKKSPYYIT